MEKIRDSILERTIRKMENILKLPNTIFNNASFNLTQLDFLSRALWITSFVPSSSIQEQYSEFNRLGNQYKSKYGV